MTISAQPLVRASSLTRQYPGVTALDGIPHGVIGLVGSLALSGVEVGERA